MLRALAILALLYTPAVDAKCAMMGLAPKVLTPAAIPSDGGVVVGATDQQGDRLDQGDVAVQASWRWTGDAVPKIETLAPGLALYRLPTGTATSELRDGKRVQIKVTAAGTRPLLSAPKVKKITHTHGDGRRPYTYVTVELDGAVPAGALAIVVADAKGTPRSWRAVEAGKPTADVYNLTRCRVLANGTIESKPGDQVTVWWIDDGGRKSPASKPIAITSKPTSQRDDD